MPGPAVWSALIAAVETSSLRRRLLIWCGLRARVRKYMLSLVTAEKKACAVTELGKAGHNLTGYPWHIANEGSLMPLPASLGEKQVALRPALLLRPKEA